MNGETELALIARRQDGVVTRAQALQVGLHRSSVAHRIRPGGPWQRLLPGVYAMIPGPATEERRISATLLYAGPEAVLTGPTALRLHGIRAWGDDPRVHVLLPRRVSRASVSFVVVHRTVRPIVATVRGSRPTSALARAAADACVAGLDEPTVRALLTELIGEARVSVDELRALLAANPRPGSAAARALLEQVAVPRHGRGPPRR